MNIELANILREEQPTKYKVSVITPTIRKEGLEIVRKALRKQTFRNFEWLIGSSFDPGIPWAKWIPDKFTGGYWTLNRIYNSLFQHSSGEIIISYQDNIHILPDTIERLVEQVERTQGIVSPVGDQFESVNKWGKPQIKVWSDPRRTSNYGSFYECTFPDIEWNLCALPKQALIDVGGFDEELDFLGFGMDGYQVNERLNEVGHKFYLDQSIESFSIAHGREDYGGQSEWDKKNNLNNGNYEKRRSDLKTSGEWPRLNYL